MVSALALDNFDFKLEDRVVSIKENGNVDASFVISHIIREILKKGRCLCLVAMHNNCRHYQAVGKMLRYDLNKKIDENRAVVIEPLEELISNDFTIDKVQFTTNLFAQIKSRITEQQSDDRKYVIIDDLSHLLDLGIDVKQILSFTNFCLDLCTTHNCSLIVNNHVSGWKPDGILAANLEYVSDLNIEVLPLKTGSNHEVTGVINIQRGDTTGHYHYKAFDGGIKTFYKGESLYNLYK